MRNNPEIIQSWWTDWVRIALIPSQLWEADHEISTAQIPAAGRICRGFSGPLQKRMDAKLPDAIGNLGGTVRSRRSDGYRRTPSSSALV